MRQHLTGGRAMITPGIAALGPAAVARLVKTIAVFDDFCEANDPYEEHDFGAFEAEGHTIFFKILVDDDIEPVDEQEFEGRVPRIRPRSRLMAGLRNGLRRPSAHAPPARTPPPALRPTRARRHPRHAEKAPIRPRSRSMRRTRSCAQSMLAEQLHRCLPAAPSRPSPRQTIRASRCSDA